MAAPLSPRRSVPSASRWRWWVLALGLVGVLAAFLALWSRPQVRLSAGAQALVHIQIGWQNRLLRVSVQSSHGPVPVMVVNGAVFPRALLTPRTQVTVVALVTGPGWNPLSHPVQDRLTLTVPPDPVLTSDRTRITLGSRVRFSLSAPSWSLMVRSGSSVSWLDLGGHGRTWEVGPSRNRPGSTGLLLVRTRARPWEAPSAPETLTWMSVPWLSATLQSSGEAGAPLGLRFSEPVSQNILADVQWTPDLSGVWRRVSTTTWSFAPSGIIWPGETLTLRITGGSKGVRAVTGSYLAKTEALTWQAPAGSLLRAQQLLAKLGYLPLVWTNGGTPVADSDAAQVAAAYAPPTGSFAWRYANTPPSLAALWQPGADTVMTTGAVMTFERRQGLAVDGVVGPAVWQALITAVMNNQTNPDGYTYVYVSETLPEQLSVWHNGQVVLTSPTNTGIPQSPTYLGTYPVYLRYLSQTMSGVNPNGTPYNDPGVPWVNYFAGGDAVHGFPRAQYGFPQSLGCVELPIPTAAIVWTYMHYGTLVTVEPPGSPRSP